MYRKEFQCLMQRSSPENPLTSNQQYGNRSEYLLFLDYSVLSIIHIQALRRATNLGDRFHSVRIRLSDHHAEEMKVGISFKNTELMINFKLPGKK